MGRALATHIERLDAAMRRALVVEKVAKESLRDIKFMHSRTIHIDGREVRALRQGMAGELGYELQGPRAYAQEVYDAMLEAGREFGIRQLGGRAVFINHLEACFPTIITDYLPAIFEDDMKEQWLPSSGANQASRRRRSERRLPQLRTRRTTGASASVNCSLALLFCSSGCTTESRVSPICFLLSVRAVDIDS